MSDYANPAKARLWLDGDAFRAPAGTALPADIFASSLTGWEAFGGIKAGFEVETAQDNERLTIFNKEGTYRLKKGDEEITIRFRPVDYSKATALTLLLGGSIVAAAGGFEWIKGDEEQFAFIIRVQDGSDWKAYYCEKAELINKPTEALNDDDIEGWDLEITPLVPDSGGIPMRPFTSNNPLA
jgi:hypothetical protein